MKQILCAVAVYIVGVVVLGVGIAWAADRLLPIFWTGVLQAITEITQAIVAGQVK